MGSLGPLSLEALILGAVQLQILVIWGPYEPPVVVALETQAEILKTAGAWCANVITTFLHIKVNILKQKIILSHHLIFE